MKDKNSDKLAINRQNFAWVRLQLKFAFKYGPERIYIICLTACFCWCLGSLYKRTLMVCYIMTS